jgi:cell division protein FtsN
MTEAGTSLRPEPPDSPRVPPPNRPAAADRRESGDWAPPPARPRPAPVRLAPLTPGTATSKGITFTLQKNTLTSLIGGLLVLGVVIFIGGFLSGVRFMLSRQPAQTEASAPLAAAPAGAAAPGTAAPALPSGGSAPKDAKAALAKANTPAGNLQQNTAATSAPPAQTTPQTAGPEAPPPAAETADNLAIKPPVPLLLQPALKAGDRPTLAPASVAVRVNPLTGPLPLPPPSDRNQRPFTLQAGAFLDKADADRVSAELQSRGYKMTVLKTVDAGQREWFRVRTGEYATLEQATAAAQAFQEKERIPVDVVRQPAGPPQK